jgi:hypothetical protein
VEGLEPLSDAEQRLVTAVRNGQLCDFSDGKEIRRDGMAMWGDDRVIRADVLNALLAGENDFEIQAGAPVDLRGAVVSGKGEFSRTIDELSGPAPSKGRRLPRIRMESCRFDANVYFRAANFTNIADFKGTTFNGDAWFGNGVTFARAAWFDDVTFNGTAWFGDSATFSGNVKFDRATFTDKAFFHNATFANGATFTGASFIGDALFAGATFIASAFFDDSVTFAGAAWFNSALVTEWANFAEATFTDEANFEGALARSWVFTSATFLARDPGPWIGSSVILDRAVFALRSRISITATQIDAKWIQAREGVHLLLHSKQLDLSDAEFLRPSILGGPAAVYVPPPSEPEPRAVEPVDDSANAKTIARVRMAKKKFREDVAEEFANLPPSCHVTSLARANVADVVLSNVVLNDCRFAGALGLDEVRISADCEFQYTPRFWRWGSLFTRRRMIAEEFDWREKHAARATVGRGVTPDDDDDRRADSKLVGVARRGQGFWLVKHDSLSALDIAAIYRDLRKGLEDAKNEPAAADFYYGEMEMRRLANRREGGHRCRRRERNQDAQPESYRLRVWLGRIRRIPRLIRLRRLSRRSASLTEGALLYGYWAVSGYGLRASRALLTLTAIVFLAGSLYTNSTFATVSSTPPRIAAVSPINGAVSYTSPQSPRTASFSTALEFSARESISLLQARNTPGLTTRGPGTVLDFVLRLAGPVLLAFAVLALRARTRR